MMRTKIAYLSICITLVYWLGGMVGCATSPRDAQNEDMLHEDRPLLDTSPPGDGGNQFQTHNGQQVNVVMASIQNSQTVIETTEPVSMNTPMSEGDTQISVTNFDRSSWGTITTTPATGKVNHGKIYFNDQPDRLFAHTTVDLNESSEVAMEAAMDDIEYKLDSKREWKTSLIQPLKFCWDMFTLPYNSLVKDPFWQSTNPVVAQPMVEETASE